MCFVTQGDMSRLICDFYRRTAARPTVDYLVGLVVKASTLRAEDLGFESRLRRTFPGRVIPET